MLLMGPCPHASRPITAAERKQSSKWSRPRHMRLPGAGDICRLNVRGVVPLYPEKAEWVPGGKNKGISHGCETGHRYYLEH